MDSLEKKKRFWSEAYTLWQIFILYDFMDFWLYVLRK